MCCMSKASVSLCSSKLWVAFKWEFPKCLKKVAGVLSPCTSCRDNHLYHMRVLPIKYAFFLPVKLEHTFYIDGVVSYQRSSRWSQRGSTWNRPPREQFHISSQSPGRTLAPSQPNPTAGWWKSWWLRRGQGGVQGGGSLQEFLNQWASAMETCLPTNRKHKEKSDGSWFRVRLNEVKERKEGAVIDSSTQQWVLTQRWSCFITCMGETRPSRTGLAEDELKLKCRHCQQSVVFDQ